MLCDKLNIWYINQSAISFLCLDFYFNMHVDYDFNHIAYLFNDVHDAIVVQLCLFSDNDLCEMCTQV